jgi:hypothetical protein
MDFVDPRPMQSPISGQTIRPVLKTFIRGNQEIVEAHYIDPASGAFVHKGVVSIKDVSKPKPEAK